MGKDGDIDGVWRPLIAGGGGGGAGELMYRLRPATPEELARAKQMQTEREAEAAKAHSEGKV